MNNFFNYGMNALSQIGGSGGGSNIFSILSQFDRNGDGRIMEDDFVAAVNQYGLGAIGEYAVRNIFRQLDTNRNGQLDLNEAIQAFQLVQSYLQQSGGQV